MLIIVLGFAVMNLVRKNEKQEDILVEYMKYLNKITRKDISFKVG